MLNDTENKNIFNKKCNFVLGITNIKNLPTFNLPEIAFWGRSNVGKSNLMNSLLGTKKLVKVSSTPGKTKEINFFNLNNKLILTDLPGYGFAITSKHTKNTWNSLTLDYFTNNPNLKRIFLLIDANVGFKPLDIEAMKLLDYLGKSYILVATKIDKLNKNMLNVTYENIQVESKKHPAAYPDIFLTSSKNSYGIKELQSNIIKTIL